MANHLNIHYQDITQFRKIFLEGPFWRDESHL